MPTITRAVIAQLYQQHEQLRAIAADCEVLADRFDAGHPVASQLVRRIARLRTAVAAHNRYEESILRPILIAAADPRGDVDRMVHEHVREHGRVRHDLSVAGAAVTSVDDLRSVLVALHRHLAEEERYFAMLYDTCEPVTGEAR